MIKLYNDKNEYWEAWEHKGEFIAHWGELGSQGFTTKIERTFFRSAKKRLEKAIAKKRSEGFREKDREELYTLIVEFEVEGHGTGKDIDKRERLFERMNDLLGWTGLGHCDGGSIGSGTMEVCCFVVSFDLAKKVIAKDLTGTEFENYSRIYDENNECEKI